MKESGNRWGISTAVLALVIGMGTAQGQTEDEGDQTKTREGEALYSPDKESSLSGPDTDGAEVPRTGELPLMIRERLRLFEQKREAYLTEQLKLVREMRGATDAERAELRERLREQRQAWLDEARQIREQARLRLQEMKRELSNHGEVIDAARERAREQAREGAQNARERRGTD